MKKILFILLILLCLPIVFSVQESLQPVKQDECFNITQICASCTYINFTGVYNPVHVRVLDNTLATKNDSLYYTEFCNTSLTGEYIVTGIGDIDGSDEVFTYNFEVTESGNELRSIMQGVFIFIIIYIVGLFWLSNNLRIYKYDEDNSNAKKGLFWIGLLHVLALMFMAWFDYMGYVGVSNVLITLAIINGSLIVYLLFIWFVEMMIDPIDYAIEDNFRNEK